MGGRVGDKRDFFFPSVPLERRRELRLDKVASYSVTDERSAAAMTAVIARYVGATAHVVDATACVGGNTISFAGAFARVTAIEVDGVRLEHLRHNVGVMGVAANVECMLGSCVDRLPAIDSDAVFFDPPWGGPEYAAQERVSLSIGDVGLADLVNATAQRTRFVFLKLPTNFDVDAFAAQCAHPIVERITSMRKMLFLVVDCRPAQEGE